MNNQDIINYYLEGYSLAKTCDKFNISKNQLKTILKQRNIDIRSRHEQCILENKRRSYTINHNYFSVLDCQDKAYWLGFIAADGTVRKNRNEIKISLQASDDKILIQLKKDLQSAAPIKYYQTYKKKNVVEFKFSSEQIKKDLAYYSIVPNKTYIGVTMKNIPSKYKMAFIKGFFDGDGSYSNGKVKISSHLDGILKEIQEFLPQKTYIYFFEKRNIYSLEMSTVPSREFINNLKQINTPSLDRKYQ